MLLQRYKSFVSGKSYTSVVTASLFAGFVWAYLFKEYVIVEGGSIFILCGAVIAGAMSYFAVESGRELKAKEEKRKSVETLGDMSFELVDKYQELEDYLRKTLESNREMELAARGVLRVKKWLGEVEKKKKELEGEKESFLYRKLESRELDLKKREEVYRERVDDKKRQLGDDGLEATNEFNEIAKRHNKLRLFVSKFEDDPWFEDCNISGLIDRFSEETSKADFCHDSVKERVIDEVYKGESVSELIVSLDFSENDQKKIEEMNSLEAYGPPSVVEMYEEVEASLKVKSLHLSEHSKEYYLVRNLCMSLVMFSFSIALLNGFSLEF